MSRVDELNKVVRSLQASNTEIEACALISEDSLMIASALPQHIEEARVSSITATLHNLGNQAGKELERGDIDQVLVHGEEGYAVMVSATDDTLLLVLASEGAKLGLVFLDMKKAVQLIKKVL